MTRALFEIRRRPPRAAVGRVAILALALTGFLLAPAMDARAQQGCRLPSDDQYEAGGALEGILLVLHGLTLETVPLEYGVAFGDPGPCPGGSQDAFRGIDIIGWLTEESGPANPTLCSPDDPPIMELPLRSTRCVEPSTTVASRVARVAYGELITRAPFSIVVPSILPEGLQPHWTTLRATDWRDGRAREYGAIVRYRGEQEEPWLVLLLDNGTSGGWWLEATRARGAALPLGGRLATVVDSLPDYDGPGTGLLWEEAGLRLILFGTYNPRQLAGIASQMAAPIRAAAESATR